jgi:hypothetical protein
LDEARLRARLAGGSIGQAVELNIAEYREMRNVLLETIETAAVSRDSIRLLNASEYLGKKLDKDEFEIHINALMVLLGDLFHLKLGCSNESLINEDIVERLERIAEALTVEQITTWTDGIAEMFLALVRNVNRQLMMESLFLTA